MEKITQGFVLAAGLGTRMAPLTDTCPKPLLSVANKTMIDRSIDALKNVGVEDITVNTHYLGDLIEEHLGYRDDVNIQFSNEEEILETGGGVKKALANFNNKPFYVLNSDVICTDGAKHYLQNLAEFWDTDKMDILLQLYPIDKLLVKKENGDYQIDNSGKLIFKDNLDTKAKYLFTGPRIIHPRIFDNITDKAFSFKKLFDQAEEKKRLYGIVHDGEWFHIGTPEELMKTDELFKKRMAA